MPTKSPDGSESEEDKKLDAHVFGIYEAATSSDAGFATVHVTRPGPMVLVLSAYEATTWTVIAGPETEIRSIYLLGYEAQKLAQAPNSIKVFSSFEAAGEFLGCAYEWPDADPHSGCETGPFLAALQEAFGLDVASFHGCYAGSSFTLTDDGASGACLTELGYAFTGFP